MDELYKIVLTAIPVVLGLAVGYLVKRYRDPLKWLKGLSSSPILSALAAAAVLIAEAAWSDWGGEFQFERAIELLVDWSCGALTVEQAHEIVQVVYQALKKLLGEHWDGLKVGLIPNA